MTRRRFSKVLALAAVVLTSLAGSSARAQKGDGGPVVILTAKSAGELIADARYLVGALMKPDDPQAGQVLGVLDGLKNPQALQGLDPSKAVGLFGSPPDGDKPPTVVLFLPVLDGQKLLDAMAGAGVTVEADNTSPGFTHKVTFPNSPFPAFVTQGGGYLYLSLAPVDAAGLKAMKPATLLPKRTGAGDLSLTVRVDRIPAAMKDQYLDAFSASMAGKREREPNEPEVQFQTRLATQTLGEKMLTSLIRDSKELSLDLMVDPKTEFLGVELNSSAVAGTEYGKALRKLSSMKSRFRGMTANAAAGGYVAIPVAQGLRDMLSTALDQHLAQAKKDPKASEPAMQALIEEATPAVRDLLTSETLDVGMAIQGPTTGSKPTYAIAGGMAVKGGKRFEKIIRDAMKTAPDDQKKDVKLDFAKTTDGTPIHKITGPDSDAGPMGEAAIYAAFKDDVIGIGMGKAGQAALTTALGGKTAAGATTASATAPQVEFFLSASKLAGMGKEPKQRDAMMAASKEVFTGAAAKKDKVSLVLKSQGEAMSLRVGMDVPAVKFFARMSEIMRGQ